MRKLAVVLLLVVASTTARATEADATSTRLRLRGDLSAGQVDRIAFVASRETRLTVRLEANSDLALEVVVVGPSGALDVDDDLRTKDDGRDLKLKRLELPVDGLYRLEIRGTGDGSYEGKFSLDVPSSTKRTVVTGPGTALVDLALAPDAAWKRIRVKPVDSAVGAGAAALTDPADTTVPLARRDRSRGYELTTDAGEEPGLYRLAIGPGGGHGEVKVKVKVVVTRPARTLLDLTDGLEDEEDHGTPLGATQGEVLVRLAKGTRLEDVRDRHDDLDFEAIPGTEYFRVRLREDEEEDDDDEEEALEDLFEDSGVLHAERNLLTQAPEGGQSSLPVLDDNLDDENCIHQPALDRIGAPAARGLATGRGQIVAVLDTGIDPTHPFLAGRIAPGGRDLVDGDDDPREERDGLDGDGDGRVDEGYGHGTFVAGLVLALAPEARILPIRVLDSDARGDAARVAEGVLLALDAGADVINLSLGTTEEARIIRDATHLARERGVIVVVAAGNEADLIQFPARYGNTLAVTAVDVDGIAADFTNLGAMADLAAPGVDLIGPLPTDSGASYGVWSGTSFAAPLVSAAAALVREALPWLDGDDVADRLRERSEDLTALNPEVGELLGEGLVRPDLAVATGD